MLVSSLPDLHAGSIDLDKVREVRKHVRYHPLPHSPPPPRNENVEAEAKP